MKFVKPLLTLFLFICISSVEAQEDTTSINTLIRYTAKLDPDKTDSIHYYSRYIKEASSKINYPFGLAVASRLLGRYYQHKENFDSAIIEFHEYARQAEKNKVPTQQMNALSDIAGVYMMTEQYELAKQNYIGYLQLAEKLGTTQSNLAQVNNNLAGAYQYLTMYDSAVLYYSKAMKIDEELKDSVGLAERKSNISEVLIPLGQIELARKYLMESTEYNERNDLTDALWYNYNNLGNINLILKDYKKSDYYYVLSYELAKKTSTRTKIVESLVGFSKLYRQQGNYQKAFDYKTQADSIESLIVNENTNKKIAELQEKYQAEKREQQNLVLATKLEKESLQKRNLFLIAASFFVIAAIISYALYINNKRKNLLAEQNKLINEQKDKLSQLNLEKNSLISIVSHDLSTPIVNIQLWSKILSQKIDKTDPTPFKALEKIQESAEYSYELIQNILNVEKAETGHHKIQLEKINLQHCMNEIKDDFTGASEKKQIQLHLKVEQPDCTLLTDKILLKRILENLVSNALKFSFPQTSVWINVQQVSGVTTFSVKDEGRGISKEDQQRLFGKYVRLSNLPTANESSTGLGLHIVKRIAEELGCKIVVESSPGQGANFKVVFS